jgi:hypothetical protein
MIPRLAALSIAEINARTCSGLGVCTERTVFCIVRRWVTTLRLRSARFTVWRARLAADLVFAIVIKKNLWICTLASALRLSTLGGFPSLRLIHPPTHKRRIRTGLNATIACSIRASLFGAEQQVPHPFAFLRQRAQRWKLEQQLSGPGPEVLHSRLRKY